MLRVEERIYKLERDEAALMKRIQETNLQATSVEGFLYQRLGGTMGDLDKSGKPASLDTLIDKKRIYQKTRVILENVEVSI